VSNRAVRTLSRVHRWMGVPLSFLVLVWFGSGMVMTIGGFPGVTDRERLERGGRLVANEGAVADVASLPLGATPAALAAGLGGALDAARLVPRLGRAVWELESSGEVRRFDAGTGAALPRITEPEARALAQAWLGAPLARVERLDGPDTWTPRAEALGWLPVLHAETERGRDAYVSLSRGDVVQHTTPRSRLIAWIGAIPHWLYVVPLRRHGAVWRWTVIVLATAGALGALAGLVLGAVRLGAHARRHGGFGPFRKGMFRWHQGLGLTVGLLAFTWLVSGALSLDPLAHDGDGAPTADDHLRAAGGRLDIARFTRPVQDAATACSLRLAVRRIELAQIAGVPFYVCRESPTRALLVSAAGDGPPLDRLPDALAARELAALVGVSEPDSARALAAARAPAPADGAAPSAPALRVTLLEHPDAYYYPTHFDPDRPFPVLRVASKGVTYYVDDATGWLLRRDDGTSRTYRWIYHGLHSFDFPGLIEKPRLWQAFVLLLGGAGALLAATAVALAKRRVVGVPGRRR
jgi:hypothetical protein